MRMRRGRGRASWVALIAAYLLFFQTVIGGFAIGAGAALVPLDSLSALCSLDGGGSTPDRSGDRQPAGHAHLPDCCTTGCSMFGGQLGPGFVAVLPVPRLASETQPALLRAAPMVAAARRSPANPRAPPAQA